MAVVSCHDRSNNFIDRPDVAGRILQGGSGEIVGLHKTARGPAWSRSMVLKEAACTSVFAYTHFHSGEFRDARTAHKLANRKSPTNRLRQTHASIPTKHFGYRAIFVLRCYSEQLGQILLAEDVN